MGVGLLRKKEESLKQFQRTVFIKKQKKFYTFPKGWESNRICEKEQNKLNICKMDDCSYHFY